MENEIEDYFTKPEKKKYVYNWSTWDALSEVDRLMESHHGWRPVNWQSLPGIKERSVHSLNSKKIRS